MVKNLGWRSGQHYVTGARHQAFEATEWSRIRPGIINLLWQVAYEVIPVDHEHFEWLAWPCMIVRWHHWRRICLHVPFFSLPVWPPFRSNFDLRPLPLVSTKKKIYQIRAFDFGVQFSFRRGSYFIQYAIVSCLTKRNSNRIIAKLTILGQRTRSTAYVMDSPGVPREKELFFQNVCAGKGSSLQKYGSMVHCVHVSACHPGPSSGYNLKMLRKLNFLNTKWATQVLSQVDIGVQC